MKNSVFILQSQPYIIRLSMSVIAMVIHKINKNDVHYNFDHYNFNRARVVLYFIFVF